MELKDLAPAIVIILLIGIVLGIGMFVMSEIRSQVATEYTGSDNSVVVNSTISSSNQTTLSDASKDDYELISIDSVVNSTGTALPTDNYTYTDAGVITWADDLVAGNSYVALGGTVNISSTYIYDATDSPEAGINDTLQGLGDFAGWIAVIVVVIAAALVLGIVLKSFGGGMNA